MKIAVFGGTGQTGKAFVTQALQAGHKVRVLARTPEKMDLVHDHLQVLKGDVTHQADVQQALEGQDIAVCTIGGNGLSDASTRTIGTGHIITAMKSMQIKKLVVCSVLGIGGSKKHLGMMGHMVLKTILKKPRQDHEAQEELVYNSGLEWVIIRPPQLINGPSSGTYKVVAENERNFVGTKMTRADVAHCMMRACQEDGWVKQAWSISY